MGSLTPFLIHSKQHIGKGLGSEDHVDVGYFRNTNIPTNWEDL